MTTSAHQHPLQLSEQQPAYLCTVSALLILPRKLCVYSLGWFDMTNNVKEQSGMASIIPAQTTRWFEQGLQDMTAIQKPTRSFIFRQKMKEAEKSETLPAWRAEMQRIFLDVQGFPGLSFGAKIKLFPFIFMGKGRNIWRRSAETFMCSQTEGRIYVTALLSSANVL